MDKALAADKAVSHKLSRWLSLVVGVVLTLAVLYIFKDTLVRLVLQLAESDDYSWGLLFPLVAAYIVYKKWPQVRTLFGRPAWPGLLIMAGGLLLYVAAELAAELYTTRLAFNVVLAGMVFLLGGWKLLRLLAFPLLLLVLMIPLPQLITQKLTLPLQLISSRLAADMFYILGVPVFLQGNVIDLGTQQLQIVEACSGLRYVLGIVALGLTYCYFYQRRPWKVAVLLLSLIPVAILLNALRLVFIGFFPILKEGLWHTLFGWSIFVMFFDIIVGINWLINRLSPEPPPPAAASPKAAAEDAPLRPLKPLTPYLLAGVALVVAAAPLVHRATLAPPVPLLQSLNNFPMEVGPWRGRMVPVDPEMVKLTQSHAHLNAEYVNPGHARSPCGWPIMKPRKKPGASSTPPKAA